MLKGHRRATQGAAFTTDGRTLATVNDDRTLKLWSLSTSREVASFNLPQEAGRVGFSPDGRFLVAYGWRSQVCTIWYAPTWEEIDAVEAKAKGETKLP